MGNNNNNPKCQEYETCANRDSQDIMYQGFYCNTHLWCACQFRKDAMLLDSFLIKVIDKEKERFVQAQGVRT